MLGHPHRRLDEGDMRAPEAGQGPGSEAKRLRRITSACSRRPSAAADTAFSRRSVHRWVRGEPATSRCPCVSGCPSPKRRRDPLRWEPFFARDRRPCGTEFIGAITCGRISVSGGLRWEERTVRVVACGSGGWPGVYAARRTYRWWRPPTSRSGTTLPASGPSTRLPWGASLSSERCVRVR